MNRARLFALTPSLLALTLLTVPSLTRGQADPDPEIDARISVVKDLFVELDAAAETCLDDGTTSEDSCQAFSDSINGDTIPTYLEHCRVLKEWRDGLVEETQRTGVDPANQERTLGLLIDVEFTCGEEALTKRTQYVLAAFAKIRAPRYLIPDPAIAIRNQRQADNIDYTLRNSLLDGIENQQRHIGGEVQQLWNRLELENLRRQSQRPTSVGTINQ
ncbi:MAG: hypothetical protein MI746_01995 [Pseudomonadales bacterium]|nr:hypothetical protein [Pseudomonadales bacterium]